MIIDPSVIRQVSREKDIDPEKMFAALEEAMSSAARKFYRDKAVVTEYFTAPKPTATGDQWLIVTTIVDDPQYLGTQPEGREFGPLFGPLVRTTNFKRLKDASGWTPTPCSAR